MKAPRVLSASMPLYNEVVGDKVMFDNEDNAAADAIMEHDAQQMIDENAQHVPEGILYTHLNICQRSLIFRPWRWWWGYWWLWRWRRYWWLRGWWWGQCSIRWSSPSSSIPNRIFNLHQQRRYGGNDRKDCLHERETTPRYYRWRWRKTFFSFFHVFLGVNASAELEKVLLKTLYIKQDESNTNRLCSPSTTLGNVIHLDTKEFLTHLVPDSLAQRQLADLFKVTNIL